MFVCLLRASTSPATDFTLGSANGFSPSSIARLWRIVSESIVTRMSSFARANVVICAWRFPRFAVRIQENSTPAGACAVQRARASE
jgi:hypothetical protein